MTERQLPKGWRVLPFREIAESISERIDDPKSSGLGYYVGLEHLDPDSLRIKRWGSPSDVEATKLRFYRGDVIYARRRAYQRKLGVAEWDGVCSAHALVLRARPDVCLPEFLPYFLQSDQFHQRALDISVGSLSPTINWKTLAMQEFALPSTEAQVSYVELLSEGAAVLDGLNHAAVAAQQLRDAVVVEGAHGAQDEPLGRLLVACDYGISVAPQDAGDIPILRMNNLDGGELSLADLRWVPASAVAQPDLIQAGDILFNRTNSVEHVGKVGLVPDAMPPMAFASYLIRLRVDLDQALPEYVTGFLQSAVGRSRISRHVTLGVSQANVNSTNLKKVTVPVPSLSAQRRVVQQWKQTRELQRAIDAHTTWTRAASARLREALLRGDRDV